MRFMFAEPYPEFEQWLTEHGHEVIDRNRRTYGRVYLDDIQYPMKRLAQECQADVVVIPELWGADQIGYSKEQVLATSQRAVVLGFTKPYREWRGAGTCRCAPHNLNVAVYDSLEEAGIHARSSGRAVYFSGNFQPILDALVHIKTKQRYLVYSKATCWR